MGNNHPISDSGKLPDNGTTAFFYRIRTRLLLTFGTLTVVGVVIMEAVSLLGLPFIGIQGTIEQTRQHSLQTLNEIANSRRDTLHEWLVDRRREVQVLANAEVLGAALVALVNQISYRAKLGAMDAAYWESYKRSSLFATLTRELQNVCDTSDGIYEAVGWLDPESGYVIASSRDEAVGSNLLGDTLFERARAPGNFEVIDIFRSPVDGKTYLAFTHQVFARDAEGNPTELRAIAMFLVRAEAIPLTDGGFEGLGRTGETLLINHDQRLMSSLRHRLPNGTAAERMNYRMETRLAELAAAGGEGLLAEWDYRGVPVLAAYRHILVSQEMGWGILVKQDESEILAPIYEKLTQRIVLALLLIALMVVAVVIISRRISAPIASLAAAARALENGDLAARSGLNRRDEIGLLARTFDAMAQRVQAWQESLNRELDARTRQLVRANQLYSTLSETNQTIVRTLDRDTLFAEVCRIAVEFGQFKAAWITSHHQETGEFHRESHFHGEILQCWETNTVGRNACSLVGVCAKTDTPFIVNDVTTDPRVGGCREHLLQAGCLAVATFPLHAEGRLFGTFTVVNDEPNIFEPREVSLLNEMAGDIGFAIQTIAKEKQRAAAEAAVRIQEARLDAITTSALDAVISIDQNGAIEFWNPAAEKLFGYTVQEAIGRPIHDLVTPVAMRDAANKGFGHFQLSGSGPIVGKTVEMTALHRDGGTVLVELSASAVQDGNAWRAVAIARDITERKKAEEALRLVAEELSVESGADFFQTAANGLAKLLGADYVLVGELRDDEHAVMIVGLAAPKEFGGGGRYPLAGSPCANVVEKGYAVYESAAAARFPEAKQLTQMGVEAYAGIPLLDSAGKVIGLIAAMWRRPLEEKEHPEPVLRIFSGRVGAEMARSRADANLRESEHARRTLSYAVEQGPSGVVITDPAGNIEYVNAKFAETTGYAVEECLGKNPRFLKSGVMPPEIYREIWETILGGETWRGEMCNRKRDGELYWVSVSIAPLRDEHGQINHFVELAEDITLRKQYESQLIRQAHYDELTGLPNRILAMDRMLGDIARAERDASKMAVMFIDLDNFKQINDTLGHAVGDELLTKAADRLAGCIRETDSLSRLGGDEFVVALPEVHDSADAERVASKIVASFSEHFMVENHEIYSTVSIGITVFPDDGDTPGTLMRNADAAMYRAKAEGRDTYRFFSAELAHQSERRLNVENRLRRAVERQEFYPVYQAIMDIRTGLPIGAEILLRWNNPELNPIYPDEFIAVAEDVGLIVPIGEYVLRAACTEAVSWQALLGHPLRVAVNVSARQFRTNDFVALVGEILAETSLHPSLLEIEVTERAVVDDVGKAIVVLNDLRAMGIRISMDDFGTGYSSLSYLHDLPIDTLKIDKSFVRDIVSDSHDAKLTEAIIAIGRSMNLDVLAEGVEEKDQLEFLQHHGCDLAQGYHFSKPIPAEAFREFLRKYQTA